MRLALVGLLLLSLAVTGCDLVVEERNHDPITASGTVVLARSGVPLAGISVTIIDIVPPGITSVVAATRTDASGSFSLSYDPLEAVGAVSRVGYALEINTNPYDDRYTTAGDGGVFPGETLDLGMVELSLSPAQ